jgi:predicted DCC family thiol-disulfide oxidoreductase YuxK
MPAKPVLIYDGDCRFCCRWVGAWKAVTGDRVNYEPSQIAGSRFPKIPQEDFARAVQWVGADGSVCSGAEAVFSALATAAWYGRLALALYRKAPVFARLTESVYACAATHRGVFSKLTRKP